MSTPAPDKVEVAVTVLRPMSRAIAYLALLGLRAAGYELPDDRTP